MNMREMKASLRAKHKRLRSKFAPEEKKKLDESLEKAFLNSEEYARCETLLAFASSPIETDTFGILKAALNDGKTLALPRCVNTSGDMRFYLISAFDCLEEGMFSILEPNPGLCEPVKSFENSLCLVPGLCFDMRGYRLGFGKGYYDRFLSGFGGKTVGLCYGACIEKELPVGPFDKPVDAVITENRTNRIKSSL